MKKKTPLQRAVKRILLYRLGLTVTVLALFFAGTSYYHSKNMITHAVIQATKIQVNVIQGRLKELMSRPGTDMASALQDAVNYPPDTKIHLKEGEFIYALLHSGNRQSLGSYEHADDPALAGIKGYLSRTALIYPEYEHLKMFIVRFRMRSYF